MGAVAPRTSRRVVSNWRVEHFFDPDAGDFSMAHGVPVRSLCGVWLPPVLNAQNVPVTFGRQGVSVEATTSDCRRCVRIAAARARAQMRRALGL